jgi:hypothetical protein
MMRDQTYASRVREIYRGRGWRDTSLDKLDAALRRKLAKEDGLSPERIEIELERVMAVVFKQIAD